MAAASSRDSEDYIPTEFEYTDAINKCKAYIIANNIPSPYYGTLINGMCYRVNNVSLYDFFINNTDNTHFTPENEHSPPLPLSPYPGHLFFLRYNKDQNEYSPLPLAFLKLKLPTDELDLSFDTNFEEGMRDIPDIYKEGLKLIKVLSMGIYFRISNVDRRNNAAHYVIYTTFADKPLVFSPYHFWEKGFIFTDLPHYILNLQESHADRRPTTIINIPGSIEEARSVYISDPVSNRISSIIEHREADEDPELIDIFSHLEGEDPRSRKTKYKSKKIQKFVNKYRKYRKSRKSRKSRK